MSHHDYEQSRWGVTRDDEWMEFYTDKSIPDYLKDEIYAAAQDFLAQIKARNNNKVPLHIGPDAYIPLLLEYIGGQNKLLNWRKQ
jgi:hypothetical protein